MSTPVCYYRLRDRTEENTERTEEEEDLNRKKKIIVYSLDALALRCQAHIYHLLHLNFIDPLWPCTWTFLLVGLTERLGLLASVLCSSTTSSGPPVLTSP
jgi:hypothetical protein